MTSLDNLNMRLDYRGGKYQQNRMIADKLRSLKKALIYSYQAGTAVLSDGREFRALFNPDKTTGDLDNKILSIPYEDVCLNDGKKEQHIKTKDGIQPTDIKNGDVIVWKETNTHWLVYLEAVEEYAYFRSDIRRCDQWIEVNGNKYWVYIRGPKENSIEYSEQSNTIINGLNYSLVMYITRNEETDNYFHRFTTVKIGNVENDWEGGHHFKTWEVQRVNPYYGDGIIEVCLDEYYENSIKEARDKEIEEQEEDEPIIESIYIDGSDSIDIYGTTTYSIMGIESAEASGGIWSCSSDKIKLTTLDETSVKVQVKYGRAFNFKLYFTIGENKYEKEISINSF